MYELPTATKILLRTVYRTMINYEKQDIVTFKFPKEPKLFSSQLMCQRSVILPEFIFLRFQPAQQIRSTISGLVEQTQFLKGSGTGQKLLNQYRYIFLRENLKVKATKILFVAYVYLLSVIFNCMLMK